MAFLDNSNLTHNWIVKYSYIERETIQKENALIIWTEDDGVGYKSYEEAEVEMLEYINFLKDYYCEYISIESGVVCEHH